MHIFGWMTCFQEQQQQKKMLYIYLTENSEGLSQGWSCFVLYKHIFSCSGYVYRMTGHKLTHIWLFAGSATDVMFPALKWSE